MSQVRLTIDGHGVTVAAGTTLLEAAKGLGIHIPTLCHVDGYDPSASCFLCAVRIEGRAGFAPSCATPAADGMLVHTQSDDVRRSRRLALELLLSDHTGDCVGPCQTGCPAGFDIPRFAKDVAAGAFERAAESASDSLTLPAALGRICPRLCEQRCHRCETGEALSVGGLHRFAADVDLASSDRHIPVKHTPTGKRVAIVGAGPAGLAAAAHLLRRGHDVVVFDAHALPGGMLRYGIPKFRLPHDVLDREIDIVRLLGGEFRPNSRLGASLSLTDLRRDFNAVFLAVGAQLSKSLDCPGDEFALPAIDLLARVAEGDTSRLGGDVVVVGGGNTAMDAARTARRLGATTVRILYRRSRRELPCLMSEVEAAEAEGITVDTQVAPVRLETAEGGSLRLTCIRMALGAPDASGRPRPVPIADSAFTILVATVVAAIGQSVDTASLVAEGLACTRHGIAADSATLRTNLDNVFAGGDAVTGADLAVRAIAAGTLAAASIDQSLSGRDVVGSPQMVNVLMRTMDEGEMAAFFRDIETTPRVDVAERAAEARLSTFDEVELGLSAEHAQREASRCLDCGCTRAGSCDLRQLATEYGADPTRFTGSRRTFSRDVSHPDITYEPGKCVLCGACVIAAAQAGDGLGLAIVGRGFNATVAVPLRGTLLEALPTAARRAAEVCPTGAITLAVASGGRCSSAREPQTHPVAFLKTRPSRTPR